MPNSNSTIVVIYTAFILRLRKLPLLCFLFDNQLLPVRKFLFDNQLLPVREFSQNNFFSAGKSDTTIKGILI